MKDQELIDHYNDLYSQHEQAFKGGPNEAVIEAAELIAPCLTLDLGAGEGRNALYLARQGFEVTAVDFSKVGLKKIQNQAKAHKLQIKTEEADILEYKWQRPYRLIVCCYVLHHLGRYEGLDLLARMKQFTDKGGLNVITAFMEGGSCYQIDPLVASNLLFAKPGEIRDFYSDWLVEYYAEAPANTRYRKPDGTYEKNMAARLIARKL